MRYITRELERKFLKLNDFFKVILVTGARQVGKTTMLKHLSSSDRTYVTMDNAMARELAQSDPVLFFRPTTPRYSLSGTSSWSYWYSFLTIPEILVAYCWAESIGDYFIIGRCFNGKKVFYA